MSITSTAQRIGIALVVVILVAGTALAVDPSADPSASASASAAEHSSTPSADGSVASPTDSPSVAVTTAPTVAPAATSSPSPARVGGPDDEATTPKAENENENESENENEGAPSADKIARIIERLGDAGITATAAQVQDLAAKVGVGGAIRVLAFAKASGKTSADILAMFEGGKGWGEIVHELDLPIGPGIGWIMGNGHGHGHGKNHDKGKPTGG